VDADGEFDDAYALWESALANGSFEDAFQALEEAAACLEQGNLTLERSIRCYEIGARLAAHCDALLADAELRITRLDEMLDQVGHMPAATPSLFDHDDE
jgi:exodeoxyribonuclease VII small subunit